MQEVKSTDALIAAWRQTIGRAKDAPAIFNTRGQVVRKFSEIEERACDFETKIELFNAGSVIAIRIGNHEDWPSILIACLRKRLAVLPLEQSISDQQRDAALKICRAIGVVETPVPGGKTPEVVQLRKTAPMPDWGEHLPGLLKLTSGTTAAPRAVRFRSEQLLADCNQICDTMGISDVDLNFGVIPISHSYGFSNLITPLIARGVPMVLSRDRMPRAVLADLGGSNATVFPGIPVEHDATNEEEGFVGQPMKGVDIEMVDPKTSASQIHVRSAALGDGYFPQSDEAKLGGGFFVPDDLLTKTTNGFRIVGRTSDLINVAGKKVNPAEVEAHLLRFSGVHQAVVFRRASILRNEEVAACAVVSPGVSEAKLLEFCRRELSAWQVPKRVFIVDSIPVNERGKINRRELAHRFAGGRDRSPLR